MDESTLKQADDRRMEKFLPWVFAADVAAIGFAIHHTTGQALGAIHITLALAVWAFGTSIYGIFHQVAAPEASRSRDATHQRSLYRIFLWFALGVALILVWHISNMYMLRPEPNCGC